MTIAGRTGAITTPAAITVATTIVTVTATTVAITTITAGTAITAGAAIAANTTVATTTAVLPLLITVVTTKPRALLFLIRASKGVWGGQLPYVPSTRKPAPPLAWFNKAQRKRFTSVIRGVEEISCDRDFRISTKLTSHRKTHREPRSQVGKGYNLGEIELKYY